MAFGGEEAGPHAGWFVVGDGVGEAWCAYGAGAADGSGCWDVGACFGVHGGGVATAVGLVAPGVVTQDASSAVKVRRARQMVPAWGSSRRAWSVPMSWDAKPGMPLV